MENKDKMTKKEWLILSVSIIKSMGAAHGERLSEESRNFSIEDLTKRIDDMDDNTIKVLCPLMRLLLDINKLAVQDARASMDAVYKCRDASHDIKPPCLN